MKKFVVSNLLACMLALGVVACTGLTTASADDLNTITGTVVSINGDDLVLSTDKGNLTFAIDKNAVKPANLAVGNRITVSYDADATLTGRTDARRVVMASAETSPGTSSGSVTTPSPTTSSTSGTSSMSGTSSTSGMGTSSTSGMGTTSTSGTTSTPSSQYQPQTTTSSQTGSQSSMGSQTGSQSELPQTASPLPLVFVVGMLSLLGALALRKRQA
jgi:hypothetical protein